MIQLLPENEVLTPQTFSAKETVDFIDRYIDKYRCETMDIDISHLNILDACYVTTMCSTKHFTKYPNGKINWIVSSCLIKDFTQSLSLGNSSYTY